MLKNVSAEKEIIREMEYLIALKEADEPYRKDRIKKLSFRLGEIVLNKKELLTSSTWTAK